MKIKLEIEAKSIELRRKNKRDLRKLNKMKKWTEGVLVEFYIVFIPTESLTSYEIILFLINPSVIPLVIPPLILKSTHGQRCINYPRFGLCNSLVVRR